VSAQDVEAVRVDLRADGERGLEALGQPLGSCHAQQVGPVDVDHVERDGDLCDPLGLGDQLLGKHGSGHDVEGVDRLDRNRLLPAESTRGEKLVMRVRGLGVAGSLAKASTSRRRSEKCR
jgi:hypothetical protein